MKLRILKEKDAPLMLEWMHDPSVVEYMREDFAHKTIEDCERFIEASRMDKSNLHLAIVDDEDEYKGTVSLKHITSRDAEFAIAIRKSAMGKGFSRYGMQSIISYGLEEMGLAEIYWYVLTENKRAVRFYDKNGWARTLQTRGGVLPENQKYIVYTATK